MHHIVATLESKLLPPFRGLADYLSRNFSGLTAHASSSAGGRLTDNPCHGIAVECLLADVAPDEPDHVALVVLVEQLNRNPRISADVCWGHPSGYIEAEFSPDSVEVSDEVLDRVFADLPRLNESLIAAVKRRKPSE